jgi:hypothetical protein
VVLVGCTSGEDGQAEREAITAPSAAEVDPEEAAAVVDAYERVRTLQSAALSGERRAEEVEEELEPLVGTELFDGMADDFSFYADEGIVYEGEFGSEPEVTALTDGDPPVATLVDCWDSTAMDIVDEETGESVKAPGKPERVPVTVRAEQTNGEWVLVELNSDFDRPC